MELNKCSRCGAFYMSDSNVCPKCMPKDNLEQLNLKNFLQENDAPISIEALSSDTGITTKNLNRFLSENDYNISL